MVDVPLISANDLTGFRGAPFVQAVTDAAAGSVRAECGWHIAPEAEETVRLRGDSSILVLPSLRVTAVASIVDSDGNTVTGWDWFENGVVQLYSGTFPRLVVVTFTHGYGQCPPELLPVIAERAASQAAGRVKSEAAGGVSVSMETAYDPVGSIVVDRYRLYGRP